ncbi:acyl-CoA thioesterase II [Psychrobacter frigidicola]|uniref:Acyl-CoA thioesterase II n=1 Tax=Psychrobacter frigidicola TaxID=45611 RepID=A0A5C7A5S1_9GAMM|nr:acyl-CoA thioesterase II [Psychrobacter frigidicola]TXD96139.1 acyl-CoA thioesterase II [Psychrobacter frigidicola]
MSDYSQLIDELLATVALIEVSPDVFEGKSHDYVGARIFGGQVLAQAIMAAAHTLDKDKPCHSLHGYFLRSGDIDQPVIYQVRRLRDGRSLSAREVTAIQYKQVRGQPPVEQVIFIMMASFSPMEEGLEYQEDMPVYPPPEDLISEQDLKEEYVGKVPDALKARFMRRRHVEIKPVKPRDPIHPEPMKPKQANWLRIHKLGLQPQAIQQALLAFSSDFYLVGTGLMSHGISFMTSGLQAASIDHSMHFHRHFDMNEWLLYDMWSDTTSNAMGLNHGQFWQEGKLVATVQQEGLMRLRVPKS